LKAITSPPRLDSTDIAILDVLQREGRLAVVELARKVNLSATPCTLRLRRLEQEGVITGYRALIAPVALGLALVVFVEVKLKSSDEASLEAFNRAIRPVPEVLECHMVGGGFDYLIKARVRDMTHYRELLGGVIGALPTVESTRSYFVMEEVKDSGPLPIPRDQRRRR
jgi:Lrp/AsnC family leucine-responsive transcriptional regulator